MRTASLFSFAFSAVFIAASCSGREPDGQSADGQVAGKNVEAPLVPGETMRITTTDRVFDLSLRRDSVVLSLSGRAMNKVHKTLDSVAVDTATKTMVGAFLTRKLTAAAEKLASKTTGFALGDLEEAKYEDGRIEFRLRDGSHPFIKFEHIKQNGRPVLEAFAPADAEQFVDAVRATKRSN
jgi:hypothetical protein